MDYSIYQQVVYQPELTEGAHLLTSVAYTYTGHRLRSWYINSQSNQNLKPCIALTTIHYKGDDEVGVIENEEVITHLVEWNQHLGPQ